MALETVFLISKARDAALSQQAHSPSSTISFRRTFDRRRVPPDDGALSAARPVAFLVEASAVVERYGVVSAESAGVLLIDVENMIGTMARPGNLVSRLDAILRHASPGTVIVAACADASITPTGISIFEEREVELLQVGASKDAADQALLDRAQSLASYGHTRFIVASADGAFGEIADLGDLEIMLWKKQAARKKGYVDRARKTHRIPRPKPVAPDTLTAVLARARAPKPVAAQAVAALNPVLLSTDTANSGTPEAPPMTPAETEAQSQNLSAPPADEAPASDNLVLLTMPKWATEVGMGLLGAGAIFAAGMIFGAGAGVGAEAARRVLR